MEKVRRSNVIRDEKAVSGKIKNIVLSENRCFWEMQFVNTRHELSNKEFGKG